MSSLKEPLNICQLISLLEPTRELSQSEIVVAVVGCLAGSQTLCYGWSGTDGHFFVRNGFSAQHMNQTLLYNYLDFFCKYGTAFKLMFDFCYKEVKDEELVICYTFNAFRSSLRYLLIDYIHRLNTISDHLVHNNDHNKAISLLGFKFWLDSDLNHNLLLQIEVLWQIFERIQAMALTQCTNYSLSFAILNAIYERIDFQKTFIQSVVYKLFIDCLKPTLDYFDYILTNGLVRDSHQEFIFTEDQQCVDSVDFWDNCLKIRTDLNEMPVFLAKHLNEILIAAKSRLMSRRLSFATNINTNESMNLFKKFLVIVDDLFKRSDCFEDVNDCKESPISDETNDNETSVEVIHPKSLSMASSERTEYDSNLNHFDVYSVHNQYYYNNDIDFELSDGNDFRVYCLPKKSMKPIELIVNEGMTQTITQICSAISSQLIHVIIDEYKDYFDNCCQYYFMRSTHVIPPYCRQLFQTLHSIDLSEIDCLFALENESTFESVPDIKPFISYNNLSSKPFEFLKNVHLIYTSIEWPLNCLFSDRAIGVFNKVFQLLLKVKYSQWLLSELSSGPEFRRSPLASRPKHLIRFKVQNIVNKLYNHLMTRIHVHINEVVVQFNRLNNFEQLLQTHNQLISRLKQTIFHRQKTLTNVVQKLLDLCWLLEQNWNSDDNESSLQDIDVNINRCNHLMETFYEVFSQT